MRSTISSFVAYFGSFFISSRAGQIQSWDPFLFCVYFVGGEGQSSRMDTGNQSQKGVLENLRKQLALAVRSIQWSYAIFWSISAKQPGALEWGCGYYNGDIKTRKTVQAVDVNADQMGLQRSDQLRELYESLSLGETSPQPKRPTAALSPEDLTDAEWYFLVCMSFVFNIGQGLPGQTLTRNETVWLRNAHRADTKVFSRSLLAKASESFNVLLCEESVLLYLSPKYLNLRPC